MLENSHAILLSYVPIYFTAFMLLSLSVVICLLSSFHHFIIISVDVLLMICLPFFLFYPLLPFFPLTLSTSLLFLPFFLSHSLVSTLPSCTFAYLSPITPPYFIIPSLYWCSCRNETWLWLICWQSLRGPLVVVPLHRGHVWLIEPGENFVRLAIMTGSLAW